jgi:hypothetical protein
MSKPNWSTASREVGEAEDRCPIRVEVSIDLDALAARLPKPTDLDDSAPIGGSVVGTLVRASRSEKLGLIQRAASQLAFEAAGEAVRDLRDAYPHVVVEPVEPDPDRGKWTGTAPGGVPNERVTTIKVV